MQLAGADPLELPPAFVDMQPTALPRARRPAGLPRPSVGGRLPVWLPLLQGERVPRVASL